MNCIQVCCAEKKPKEATVIVDPPACAAHCDYTQLSSYNSLKHGIHRLVINRYKNDWGT